MTTTTTPVPMRLPSSLTHDMKGSIDESSFQNTVERIVMRVAMSDSRTMVDQPQQQTSNNQQVLLPPTRKRKNSTNNNHHHQLVGPLTADDLSQLSFLCSSAGTLLSPSRPKVISSSSTVVTTDNSDHDNDTTRVVTPFSTVNDDQLVALLNSLELHVQIASGIDLIRSFLKVVQDQESPSQAAAAVDEWLRRDGYGAQQVNAIQLGLESAAIIVFLATRPSNNQTIVHEDAILACIGLMRCHLRRHLIPALNQTGHLSTPDETNSFCSPPPSKKQRRSKSFEGSRGESKSSNNERRSSKGADGDSGATAKKELKKLYRLIGGTISLQLVLMDRFDQMVQNLPLDDQQVLMLTSGSLPALEIDCSSPFTPASVGNVSKTTPPTQQLQLAATAVVTSAFRRYKDHRDTILEDLFPLMLKLPTGKRSLRTFGLRYSSAPAPQTLEALNVNIVGTLLGKDGPQPHTIQMITVLILSLIQSCIQRPGYQALDESKNQDETKHKWISGLLSCKVVSHSIAVELIGRCSRPKGGGGGGGSAGTSAQEFRPVLTHLVEDLLMVLVIPEYTPAAEMLLISLTRKLTSDVTSASPTLQKAGPQAPEATYLTVAFDNLGKISSILARILAVQKERPLEMTAPIADPPPEEKVVRVQCLCRRTYGNVFLLSCDNCKRWFHGSCVGIATTDVPKEWFCDSCHLGRIADREGRKHRLEGTESIINTVFAIRHTFHSFMSNRLGLAAEMDDAAKFNLARWVEQLEHDPKAKMSPVLRHRVILDLLECWGRPGPCGDPMTEDGSNRVILAVLAQSTFCLSFRSQLSTLVKLMGDEGSHSLRRLSLKAIEKTVEGDPSLMLLPVITKAVSQRFIDESISVREAAIALAGSYVVHSPAVANSFHSAFLASLTDEGVSVRKRAVKILQHVLTTNPQYKDRSAVCDAMLQRAADPKEEDGVRDLVEELFCKLWLEDGDMAAAQPATANNPAPGGRDIRRGCTRKSVTPTTSDGSKFQRRSDMAAEQMMEVVRAAGTNNRLEALLKKLLAGTSSSGQGRKKEDQMKRQEAAQKQCVPLVNSLFELLISVEEKRTARVGKDLAATLQTIAVFADVVPKAVAQHLDSILPFLKADNGVTIADETLIVEATCDVVYRVTLMLQEQIVERLSGSTASDLVNITYKFGNEALVAAVRALSTLAQYSRSDEPTVFTKKTFNLADTFYRYLYGKRDIDSFVSTTGKIRCNTHRAISVLGLISQYSNTTIDTGAWGEELEHHDNLGGVLAPDEFAWSNLALSCYRIFSHFLRKQDAQTKCLALRALGRIFVAQPRLLFLLEQVGLIEEVMSEDADVSLQLEALNCWQSILMAEEKRIDGGDAAAKLAADQNSTVSKQISGDQDGDATLFGGVLTNHARRVFEMTQSQDPLVRHAALEFLGVLLRQGLVNPNDAIPYLFALQGDVENDEIRSLALRLLMTEGEKRPDALRQRICAGVKQAYEFQKVVYAQESQPSAVVNVQRGKGLNAECILGKVFRECIASSKKQRQGLFRNLLSLFDKEEPGEATLLSPKSKRRRGFSRNRSTTTTKDLGLQSFAAQILGYLPYNTASDPLFIIYHIGTVVTLQGAQTLDQLVAVLRPLGLASSDEHDENNFAADALEKAAGSKYPGHAKDVEPLLADKTALVQFASLCQDATALALLLRLKSFLRRVYNLSETRCLEYKPDNSATDRGFGGGISKADFTKPFDATVPGGFSLSPLGGGGNVDALLRRYAEFRKLMREDNQLETSLPLDEEEEAGGAAASEKAAALTPQKRKAA